MIILFILIAVGLFKLTEAFIVGLGKFMGGLLSFFGWCILAYVAAAVLSVAVSTLLPVALVIGAVAVVKGIISD